MPYEVWHGALEKLVDEHGLHAVLEGLVAVCNVKADHFGTDWYPSENPADAPCWRDAAYAVQGAADHRDIYECSVEGIRNR